MSLRRGNGGFVSSLPREPVECFVHGEPDVKIDDHTQELNTAVTRLYNLIGTTSLKVKRL